MNSTRVSPILHTGHVICTSLPWCWFAILKMSTLWKIFWASVWPGHVTILSLAGIVVLCCNMVCPSFGQAVVYHFIVTESLPEYCWFPMKSIWVHFEITTIKIYTAQVREIILRSYTGTFTTFLLIQWLKIHGAHTLLRNYLTVLNCGGLSGQVRPRDLFSPVLAPRSMT